MSNESEPVYVAEVFYDGKWWIVGAQLDKSHADEAGEEWFMSRHVNPRTRRAPEVTAYDVMPPF